MSLARTTVRLAAVMALAGGFEQPWPTMAQGRVFDSRLDPLQITDVKSDDVLPVITVCTDDDRGRSLSDNNGGPPFEHTVSLCIDLSLGMIGELPDGEGLAFQAMPQAEPELEAMLDLFEFQVMRALADPSLPWSVLFQGAIIRLGDWSSVRYVESDSNIRLSSRRITVPVTLPTFDLVEMATEPPSPATVPPPLGPLLAAIAASSSPYAASAEGLAQLLVEAGASRPMSLPQLLRVRFIEAEQAETNDADVARGPRPSGVAEATLPTS